jgi:VanZ family protein
VSTPPAPPRSFLPQYLACFYGLAIVYASLQPFANWMPPTAGTPFFLLARPFAHWTKFDLVINVVAYAPFGFFVTLSSKSPRGAVRIANGIAGGAALSFAMETLQMFVPSRDASTLDLVANTVGASAGAVLGLAFARSRRAKPAAIAFREHWFLPGRFGDIGLALLLIWLVVQLNPGIPLFGTTFDPDLQADPPITSDMSANDIAAVLLGAASSAFQLAGVGLFLALLLRQRRFIGAAVIVLIVAAMFVKGVAAALLLKPAAWEHWLSPAVSLGVAAGTLLLLVAIWLPRPLQVALAAVALLSSVLTPMLTPDLLFARAPLSGFNWSYGQLLNFNGLTHAVLLVWPVAVAVFLFALAGRPHWGRPE